MTLLEATCSVNPCERIVPRIRKNVSSGDQHRDLLASRASYGKGLRVFVSDRRVVVGLVSSSREWVKARLYP